MGPPKSTPNEYERTIHKGREKEINKTTAGPLPICSPLKKQEAKKSLVRGVKNYGPIRTHDNIPRRMHKHNTGPIKSTEINRRYKGSYTRQNGENRVRLQGSKYIIRGTKKNNGDLHDPTKMESTIIITSNFKSIKWLNNAGICRGVKKKG